MEAERILGSRDGRSPLSPIAVNIPSIIVPPKQSRDDNAQGELPTAAGLVGPPPGSWASCDDYSEVHAAAKTDGVFSRHKFLNLTRWSVRTGSGKGRGANISKFGKRLREIFYSSTGEEPTELTDGQLDDGLRAVIGDAGLRQHTQFTSGTRQAAKEAVGLAIARGLVGAEVLQTMREESAKVYEFVASVAEEMRGGVAGALAGYNGAEEEALKIGNANALEALTVVERLAAVEDEQKRQAAEQKALKEEQKAQKEEQMRIKDEQKALRKQAAEQKKALAGVKRTADGAASVAGEALTQAEANTAMIAAAKAESERKLAESERKNEAERRRRSNERHEDIAKQAEENKQLRGQIAAVTGLANGACTKLELLVPRVDKVEAGQKVLQDKQKVLEEQQAADKLAQEALAAELPKVRTTISALEDQFHAATTDAKEREAAATVQRDALSSEVARIDSDLQAQGNKLGTMISKLGDETAHSIQKNMAAVTKRFGQHSRHISIHRVADKALEASRAEMSAKIDALELAAQDATSVRMAMYLQLDAKIHLEAQQLRVEQLNAETKVAESREQLARELQAVTSTEQVGRIEVPEAGGSSDEEPAWLAAAFDEVFKISLA